MTREEVCLPFISACSSIFDQLLDIKLSQKNPHLQDISEDRPDWELCSLIEIRNLEDLSYGYISLNLKNSSADKIARKMIGRPIGTISQELVFDTLGELANIIVGNAKKDFEDSPLKISTPMLISGQKIRLHNPAKIHRVTIIPFEFIEAGELDFFDLSISLDLKYFV